MARSEFDLIAAIRERLPAAGSRVVIGSGDDAAVVRAGGSHSVISVDTTVDGVHARLDLGEPLEAARAFGWRALTTALSDLAAMGVGAAAGAGDSGIEAYVALTLPKDASDELAIALADGLGEAATRFGVSVIGGDVTAGPVVVMSVTVVGWAGDAPAIDGPSPQLLTRSGAQLGDLVGLTGPIGAAGAGLALLLGDVDPATLPAQDVDHLVDAHLRPVPQLAKGSALLAAGATAAIDLSDGLIQDAAHVARASGVSLRLASDQLPVAPGVEAVALQLGVHPPVFAARSGEDFVLLVTVPPARRDAAEAAGVVSWVGEVTGSHGVDSDLTEGEFAVTVDGSDGAELGPAGHDHRR